MKNLLKIICCIFYFAHYQSNCLFFSSILFTLGECCSISGSDSESDEISPILSEESVKKKMFNKARNKENIFMKHPLKVFYVTEQKTLFSVYKNLLIQV